MIGKSKIFESSDPARDVWGQFNSKMANSFIVNLSELSLKDSIDSIGKIKALITDSNLTINPKGLSQYSITSYHRFITTTNGEEPFISKKDDRRNFIVRSSDEKIGDKAYFNQLYKLLDDPNIIKSCYEYFKSIPDLDKFNSLPIPVTKHQNNLKEISRSPIEVWLEDFTRQNYDSDFPFQFISTVSKTGAKHHNVITKHHS